MQSELGFDIQETVRAGSIPARVNGVVLADWLGVTQAAISQMKKAGQISVDDSGMYDLKKSVQAYLSTLRARKAPKGENVDLEKSLAFWKVENEKQKNLQWRLRYGQEIGSAILSGLANAVNNLREAIGATPAGVEAVNQFLDALNKTELDDVVYSTEAMEEYDTGDDSEKD